MFFELMLRKKYVTFTLLYISSLPKTNHLRGREFDKIGMVVLLELGKAGEIIISHV